MIAAVLLLAWLATAAVATFSVFHYWARAIRQPAPEARPFAAVFLPVKGGGDLFEACLRSLLEQDYGAYRVVVAVESLTDPAMSALRAFDGSARLTTVVAGQAAQRGQKVHNLLAGLDTLRPEDRVVVFADADMLPPADWLTQLVRPIALGRAHVTSGYRWQVPHHPNLPSRILAAINASIATTGRSREWNLCWGGSTALARETYDAIDLPTLWDGALTDDLTLSRGLSRAGIPVLAPLSVMVPSPTRQGWQSLVAFGRRQYMLLRVYRPVHWLATAWILLIPVIGFIALLGGGFDPVWAFSALAFVLVLQAVRQRLRIAIANRMLAPDIVRAGLPSVRLAAWAFPLLHLIHAGVFLTSAFGSRTRWAGILYRFDARRTQVVERRTDSE